MEYLHLANVEKDIVNPLDKLYRSGDENAWIAEHIRTIWKTPAGGLDILGKWRNSKKKFFIPVKVLSKVFRGKLTLCKSLTNTKVLTKENISPLKILKKVSGKDFNLCPVCGIGHLIRPSPA